MNNIGFIQLPLDTKCMAVKPTVWDRQTVAILFHSDSVGIDIMNQIRRINRPKSQSKGNGYIIDVYINLNYSPNEKDPAMRNIRIVYCDMKILDMKSVYNRFPNAYIINVDERSEGSGTQRIGRKVPEISGT